MPAIQLPMLNVLKQILEEHYVPFLPPLDDPNGTPEQRQKKQISRAFSAFVLQAMLGIDARTASQDVVDNFNDNGIDALHYHEDNKTLYVVQSKLKATEQFSQGDAQTFSTGIRLLINNELDDFNDDIKNRSDEIGNALNECDHIKLVVAYTGNGVSTHAVTVLARLVEREQEELDQLSDDIIYFDAQHIEQALQNEHALSPIDVDLTIYNFRELKVPRKTAIGLVKISDLIKLHDKHEKALYEKNIRYFLGAGKRGVNSAIKKTLESQPEDFLYLNNGITFICDNLKGRGKNRTTKNFKLTGASVVNGAQTIASASQFKESHPEANISKAKVMVTVIHADSDGNFHKQVTKARNLQNPVELSNFAALDETQEKLRREIALYGIEYHYRPQQTINHQTLVIDIDDLAKSLACLYRDARYPAYLKTSLGQFINSESDYYKSIFIAELRGSVAVNAVLVYNVIIDLLKQADLSSQSPERLVYRHCGYVFASILMKQLKDKIEGGDILTEEGVKVAISVPFDELRQCMFEEFNKFYGHGMAHAFFKRVGDTTEILSKVMISYLNKKEDRTVQNIKATNDLYHKNLINYLTDQAPQL